MSTPSRPAHRARGFTIIEMVIVLAIFSILALIGLPALLKMLARQSLVSAAHETAGLMRQARFTAVKRGMNVRVAVNYAQRQMTAFTDQDDDCVIDAGVDEVIATQVFSKGVELWGPNDSGPGGNNASAGFVEDAQKQGCADFNANGSATANGSFRMRGKDGDFLEVHVEPAATGRVALRKWFGGGDPDTNWWQNGEQGRNWWS